MRSDENDLVTLSDARSTLTTAPGAGGRLMRWCVDGQDILYWPASFDLSKAAKIRGGNPLLFPFIGRHRVGATANQWQDAEGHLFDLPQHGFARDLPFSVSARTAQSVTMCLTSDAATRVGYPFDFTFEAQYSLDGDSLDVTLLTRNTGAEPLPYYAGHHFYFALPQALRGESTLTLPKTLRCAQAADGSITEALPEPSAYAPGAPEIQDRFHLITPHDGHPAPATLYTPSLGRRITIDIDRPDSAPWYAVTTWTESDESDFYCIEPWLGLPNAIHHGQGLRWIAPGASETARCRIRVAFGV